MAVVIGDIHGDEDGVVNLDLSGHDTVFLTGDIADAREIREIVFEQEEAGEDEDIPDDTLRRLCHERRQSAMAIIDNLVSKDVEVFLVNGNVERGLIEDEEDLGLQHTFKDVVEKRPDVSFLQGETVEVGDVVVGGLDYHLEEQWLSRFQQRKYDKRVDDAHEQTRLAREALDEMGNVEVLVSHIPPLGVLDTVTSEVAPSHWQGLHGGSEVVRDFVAAEDVEKVFCGHIHEGRGEEFVDGVEVVNLGVLGVRSV